jgi:hypothetical protein
MEGGKELAGDKQSSVNPLRRSEKALVLSHLYDCVLLYGLLLLFLVYPFQSVPDLANGRLEPIL